MRPSPLPLDWNLAPEHYNWCAQDENGDWYWYSVEPEPSIGGGVWRANSRNQQFACHDQPNPNWIHSLQLRPNNKTNHDPPP